MLDRGQRVTCSRSAGGRASAERALGTVPVPAPAPAPCGDAGLGAEITLTDRVLHENVSCANSVLIW